MLLVSVSVSGDVCIRCDIRGDKTTVLSNLVNEFAYIWDQQGKLRDGTALQTPSSHHKRKEFSPRAIQYSFAFLTIGSFELPKTFQLCKEKRWSKSFFKLETFLTLTTFMACQHFESESCKITVLRYIHFFFHTLYLLCSWDVSVGWSSTFIIVCFHWDKLYVVQLPKEWS